MGPGGSLNQLELAGSDLTILDVLDQWGAARPEKTAFIYLRDGERPSAWLTYHGLYTRARAIAARLRREAEEGERALLLFPPGLDFIPALFGCFYAGVVAIPAYPPPASRHVHRLRAIAADSGASWILTTAALASEISRDFAGDPGRGPSPKVLATDAIDHPSAPCSGQRVDGKGLAYLQYTSGTTGVPKGVRILHRNIVHHSKALAASVPGSEDTVSVGWIPLFHDMGLVVNVLHTVYVGGVSVLMAPTAFLQAPLRWLKAISTFRATLSGGPNFAYQLCAQAMRPEWRGAFDLSSWRIAFNGGEPIRDDTLGEFARVFEPFGFSPTALTSAYGLAEATLAVTWGASNEAPVVCQVEAEALGRHQVRHPAGQTPATARRLVGCGKGRGCGRLIVVDPESQRICPPDRIGEIWLAGGGVADGYWNRPRQTQHFFAASLADSGEGPFLRTGDLGFLRDGELYITGRLDELIFIDDTHHYPNDIEFSVERAHPALRPGCGAAFSVEVAGSRRLVVAYEVERAHLHKLHVSEVIAAIREVVAAEHGLAAYAIALLRTASIPKTTSGKIQRLLCRSAFLGASLTTIASWHAPSTQREPARPKLFR
jgi:acyl-CoA synthetase (AMP-forming)/AMP-acid ligase II